MRPRVRLKDPREKGEQQSVSKSALFTRGYNDVRKRIEKGSHFIKSCFNCAYYYQAVGDKEEVCQNPDVLKYDMVITDSSIYCNRWAMSPRKQSTKNLFRKK